MCFFFVFFLKTLGKGGNGSGGENDMMLGLWIVKHSFEVHLSREGFV